MGRAKICYDRVFLKNDALFFQGYCSMIIRGLFSFCSMLGPRFALALVVLLHLAWVIPLAAILNIWIDEAYTLQSTGGGLVHAVRRALDFELQPPLYFVLLKLWRSLDDSIFFARLFSIFCTTSTVVLAEKLARRYLPSVSPVLVAMVVAFNPLTVYAAVEARYYALALLLSALLLLFFHDGYMATQPSTAARRWYTASAVAVLYTYYFLGFLLAAGGAALFLMRRSEALRKYILDMVVTALLFAPLAVTTWRQMGSVGANGVTETKTLAEGVTLVWQTAWRQLLPVNQDNPLAVVRGWVSRLAVPLLLLGALAHRRRPTSVVLVPLILAATVSLSLVGIAMRLGSDFVKPQHTTILYLPVLLAALALLQYVVGVRAASLAAVVSLFFAGTYVLETYAPLAKQGDWIRVSRYIERREADLEPILVFRGEYVLDFGYHYAGKNRLIPLPRPMPADRYDLKSQVLRDESEILRAIEGKLGAARRFWLVTSHTQVFRGIDVHPEIMEGFAVGRCVVLRDESFLASRVRLLELRPEGWGSVVESQRIPLLQSGGQGISTEGH